MRNLGLKRAFEKYGTEGMSWEILETVSSHHKSTVWEKEKEWWIFFKDKKVNIYNGCPSGTGSVMHLKETREKISKSIKSHYNFYDIECKICKETFIVKETKKNQIYCSRTCYKKEPFRSKMPSKEVLYNLYWEESWSLKSIAKKFEVAENTAKKWLVKNNIRRRTRKEQQDRITALDIRNNKKY